MALKTTKGTKSMERTPITYDSHVHEQWYIDAKTQTAESLPEFIRHLTEDFTHDYSTICHACAAAAVAATWAVEHSGQGGITGFQAGAIMWMFITNWMTEYKDKPVRLIDYEKMLYPQFFDTFRYISSDTWNWLQEHAKTNLDDASEYMADGVRKHLQSIVDGVVPFGYYVHRDCP
jgi:hypothetical protein